MSIIRNPVRELRRSHQIGTTFARHGFGFAWEQLAPTVRTRLFRRRPESLNVPAEALAEHFRLALEELGPTFVKLGQVLSTRPDILPPAYITELARLHDRVPAAAWDEVRAVLIAEHGRPPEETFSFIDPAPLAAASLAQVHAARLVDGTEVVVKVQRSNIEQTIETDIAILSELASGAQLTPLGQVHDLPGVVEEFANTLRAELNYVREGRNADTMRKNFEGWPEVYIPKVFWDHTTRKVLVLERLYGVKIDDVAAMDALGIDRKAIARYSAQVIAKEVLEDGFFHADPHPGNFVVMATRPDDPTVGTVLGPMDFGMVGYLDQAMQMDLARLYVAAIEMDSIAVTDQLMRMGALGEDVNRRLLARDITRLLTKYRGLALKDIRASEVVADVMPLAFRHRLRLPNDLWLLGKTLSMLEGVGLTLDPTFDIFEVSGPIVRRLVRRMIVPRRSLRLSILRQRTAMADMAELMPRAAGRLLQQAERGDLFSVRFKDAAELMGVLERIATRLAISLLIAALIVGTALLVNSGQGGAWAQALMIAGFILSAGMGLWLVVSTWLASRRR